MKARGGLPHLKRTLLARALLASAAIATAIVLAGCNADSVTPTGRAQAPLSERMLADLAAKNMDKDSPILARIFKEESEVEIWKKNRDGVFARLKTYPICRWSGDLGPKKKQGDRQAPEGFYTITPGQMNPNSNYYLAFNTGYPNSYDRAWGYTGSELMVHGDCSSRGCYAMTDEQIQEIYALARESFFGGQTEFQLQAFPFRMTALNMAKHRNNPNFAFWKMLKEGYDHFSATHQEPKVAVCEKRYVFDAVAPDDATKRLSFNPEGKCPTYQLDKTIADAVLEERRQEQSKMAQYIADGVSTVPSRAGVDGGINPVFLAKLSSQNAFDNNGRIYQGQVPSNIVAPGALPRTPNSPTGSAEVRPPQPSASTPVVAARARTPDAAPHPKEADAPALQQRPASISGLFGNLFGGSQADVPGLEKQPAILNTELASKPKRATHKVSPPAATASAPVHTASAVAAPAAKQRDASPKAVAPNISTPASNPSVQQNARTEASGTREPETPENNNGLLAGAQPVVPAGSFNSFR